MGVLRVPATRASNRNAHCASSQSLCHHAAASHIPAAANGAHPSKADLQWRRNPCTNDAQYAGTIAALLRLDRPGTNLLHEQFGFSPLWSDVKYPLRITSILAALQSASVCSGISNRVDLSHSDVVSRQSLVSSRFPTPTANAIWSAASALKKTLGRTGRRVVKSRPRPHFPRSAAERGKHQPHVVEGVRAPLEGE